MSLSIDEKLYRRFDAIHALTVSTARKENENIHTAAAILSDWMVNRSIVRVVAAGRSKLIAAFAANRLAHGGAQTSLIDGIIPMPSTNKGGGILTISASGATQYVLDVILAAKKKRPSLKVVGLGGQAEQYSLCCDVYIAINENVDLENHLQALNDIKEHVLCNLLDGLVVMAGSIAGFDNTTWKQGHEDLGATGPYFGK